jgi:hypothetical protein
MTKYLNQVVKDDKIGVNTIRRLHAETQNWQKGHGYEMNSRIVLPSPLALPKDRNPFVHLGIITDDYFNTPIFEAEILYVLTEMGGYRIKTRVEVERNYRRILISGEMEGFGELNDKQRVELLQNHHDKYVSNVVELYRREIGRGRAQIHHHIEDQL